MGGAFYIYIVPNMELGVGASGVFAGILFELGDELVGVRNVPGRC